VRLLLAIAMLFSCAAQAQKEAKKRKKKSAPFKWVNPLPAHLAKNGVAHGTFQSPSMDIPVGYCIYLPAAYAKYPKRRFPVVYYLHGGRPGSEIKSVTLVPSIHAQIEAGEIQPMIYVFPNGGAVSHYNMPDRDSMGEDIIVRELIPHIDKSYRTIASRKGRAIEGFSQGGRGTTRIMFRYPELFCSAAPGGSGYATEKSISENDGHENDKLVFQPGANAYDRARLYAKKMDPPLPILIHVGTKGFNYENNLAYMAFLDELKIPYQKVIVPDAPHSAKVIYESAGRQIMAFHQKNFRKSKPRE
jgi:S-formylglutathione hydrolase FrmB